MSFIRISRCNSRQARITALKLEQDYMLLSLADAMAAGDMQEQHKCTARLNEIHMVLDYFTQSHG